MQHVQKVNGENGEKRRWKLREIIFLDNYTILDVSFETIQDWRENEIRRVLMLKCTTIYCTQCSYIAACFNVGGLFGLLTSRWAVYWHCDRAVCVCVWDIRKYERVSEPGNTEREREGEKVCLDLLSVCSSLSLSLSLCLCVCVCVCVCVCASAKRIRVRKCWWRTFSLPAHRACRMRGIKRPRLWS